MSPTEKSSVVKWEVGTLNAVNYPHKTLIYNMLEKTEAQMSRSFVEYLMVP